MRWHSVNFSIKFSVFRLWTKSSWKKNTWKCADLFFFYWQICLLFQLRESFKDLKKKFNNLKFNYTKKTEKARNLKSLKIHIQQVDTYAEKIQVILEILVLIKAGLVELKWPVFAVRDNTKCIEFPFH